MAKKVTISKDVCIGCGLCNATVPSVFEMDDDGLAKVNESAVAGEEAGVEEAAANCPVQAITVE